MDTLAVLATAVCRRVDAVRVLRIVDAGTRREALQRKVGAGLTEEEFHKLAQQKKIRHVGLTESLVFVADALGWNLEESKRKSRRCCRRRKCGREYLTVKRNDVAGVRQIARGCARRARSVAAGTADVRRRARRRATRLRFTATRRCIWSCTAARRATSPRRRSW